MSESDTQIIQPGGSSRVPKDPFDPDEVAATAQAAHQIISDLLEQMAMPDERMEAAAGVVLRRLDKLRSMR
jgi:hypothetical protein